jgi:hypothetical protein
LHNHSIAAFASRYRIAGITVDGELETFVVIRNLLGESPAPTECHPDITAILEKSETHGISQSKNAALSSNPWVPQVCSFEDLGYDTVGPEIPISRLPLFLAWRYIIPNFEP